MSATGRGTERRDADYYPTPAWCTQRLLQYVDLPDGVLLEPSAGEGHIIRAVNAVRPSLWVANELRPECKPALDPLDGVNVVISDFLASKPPPARLYVAAVGNPPFSLAAEFVEHALKWAPQVLFLLRVAFLESQKREAFFKRVGVPDLFVLPERPSFTGEGTDSCAYAWMRWRADGKQEGRTVILYDTRQTEMFGGAT